MVESAARACRILLVAGEASGDLHGGHLVRAFRQLCPTAEVVGVGGAQLGAAGMEILADVNMLSAVGLVEIAGSIPRHWRVMRLLKQQMARHRPDLVVLVDYPGFNLIVARRPTVGAFRFSSMWLRRCGLGGRGGRVAWPASSTGWR